MLYHMPFQLRLEVVLSWTQIAPEWCTKVRLDVFCYQVSINQISQVHRLALPCSLLGVDSSSQCTIALNLKTRFFYSLKTVKNGYKPMTNGHCVLAFSTGKILIGPEIPGSPAPTRLA